MQRNLKVLGTRHDYMWLGWQVMEEKPEEVNRLLLDLIQDTLKTTGK